MFYFLLLHNLRLHMDWHLLKVVSKEKYKVMIFLQSEQAVWKLYLDDLKVVLIEGIQWNLWQKHPLQL